MPSIGWNEGSPQDGDSAGLGDDEIRSLKTSVRIGLDGEHVWPSGGGDAGVHRLGSARPYVGLQSLASSTGTDGRLFHASDTSRLFGVGSGGTVFIGGPTVISAGSFPGGAAPQRSLWVEEFGEGKTVSGTTIVSLPNSGYSGKPYVTLTAYDPAGSVAQIMYLTSVTATQFTARSSATNLLGTSNTSFFWRSVGTRTT